MCVEAAEGIGMCSLASLVFSLPLTDLPSSWVYVMGEYIHFYLNFFFKFRAHYEPWLAQTFNSIASVIQVLGIICLCYTLTIWVLFLFVVIQPSLLMLLLCCLHGYTDTLHCALSTQHLTVSTWAPSPGAWLSSRHELKPVSNLIFTSCLALYLLCVLKLESEFVAGLRMNLFCNCCLYLFVWVGMGWVRREFP